MSELRAAHWFGLGLASGLLFLWCLVSAIEGGLHAGWIWGLFVFGFVCVIALALAALRYWGSARSERVDPLMRRGATDALRPGTGQRLFGSGSVPRSTSARRLQ